MWAGILPGDTTFSADRTACRSLDETEGTDVECMRHFFWQRPQRSPWPCKLHRVQSARILHPRLSLAWMNSEL